MLRGINVYSNNVISMKDMAEKASDTPYTKLYIIGVKGDIHYKFMGDLSIGGSCLWASINNGACAIINKKYATDSFKQTIQNSLDLFDRVYMFDTWEEYLKHYKNL